MDSIWIFAALFATGLVAGLVDTIAGGGGLITLPVLLGFGVDPQVALGTNKLQGSFGSGSATAHYARAKVVQLSDCWLGIFFTLVGTVLGSWAVLLVDSSLLKKLIPFLLLAIAVFLMFRPKIGEQDIAPKMGRGTFYAVFGLALGFYDGFFGPGTGTFWAIAFMVGLGFNLVKATGYTKAVNFTSNVVSVVVFALGGKINYAFGLTMAAGQLVGAYIGAHLVIRNGAKFIRPIFLAVVVALIAKLFYDNFLK
jgi:uncharacterized membrane protein YfcA